MGSRKTGEGFDKVYAAASAWVERALKADDSLFDPGKPIWTAAGLQQLRERFLDRPDFGTGGFYDKLRQQLEDSPPEVYQLMAEVLYAQFLVVWHTGMGAVAKQQQVEQVLGWAAPARTIPDHLIEGLAPGIARSMTFTLHRPYHVAFIIEFVEQWKGLPGRERERYLQDPWAFKEFASGLSFRGQLLRDQPNTPGAQREALLHLVHPDHFEGTVSVQQKETIAGASAFTKFLTEPATDVDARLAQIRRGLEEELGGDFDFYDQDVGGVNIRARWDPEEDPWNEFVSQARQCLASGRLAEDELDYKMEIAADLETVRNAALAAQPNWHDLLRHALRSRPGHPINYMLLADFNAWCSEHPEDALQALQLLWKGNSPSVVEPIRAFRGRLPDDSLRGAVGNSTNVISVLLMGLDVKEYPPYRVRMFNRAYDRTGYSKPAQNADEADVYEHALGFLDRFIAEARERGVELKNRLVAQSVVWQIPGMERGDDPSAPVSGVEDDEIEVRTAVPLEELAAELMWEPDRLQMVIRGLEDKGQVIFQGPPGTGKTFVARRIAQWYQQQGGDFRIVQFHPSYSYEDFVEGYRPAQLGDRQVGFDLVPGPLRLMAEQAREKPDATFILVIDEINRGEVAKILGELYFLLEYRDEGVDLQYSHDSFRLPRNLWFIGTMNTTDRSIALVDAALRRRFYFFGFYPDEPPVQGLLRRWLRENKREALWVADLVDAANRKLSDRHLGIGPSHFMKKHPPLDEARVRFVWEQAVMPYIEEQCFGDEGRLREFAYDRLMAEVNAAAAPSNGDGATTGGSDVDVVGPPEDGGDDPAS